MRATPHPEAEAELRWLLNLTIADHTGGGSAVLHHDAASTIDVLSGGVTPLGDQAQRKHAAALRARTWTLRCVFKANDVTELNYIEVKRMVPTLTAGGVVPTWSPVSVPAVKTNSACPFARCAAVTSDDALGLLLVGGTEAQAVRVLWAMQNPPDEESVAVTDPESWSPCAAHCTLSPRPRQHQ